jgi:hypothetical protein
MNPRHAHHLAEHEPVDERAPASDRRPSVPIGNPIVAFMQGMTPDPWESIERIRAQDDAEQITVETDADG